MIIGSVTGRFRRATLVVAGRSRTRSCLPTPVPSQLELCGFGAEDEPPHQA